VWTILARPLAIQSLFHRTSSRLAAGALTGCLSLCLVGCGSSGPDRPATYPVSGVVTFKSQPLAGAFVTLESTSQPTQTAYGTTNDAGEFTLTTFENGDGAVEGEHRVKVMKVEATAATPASEGDIPPGGPTRPAPPPKSLIPARYANFDTSVLKATVKSSGNNELKFELVD